MKKTLMTIAAVLVASPALAQFPGGGPIPVQDLPTESNTAGILNTDTGILQATQQADQYLATIVNIEEQNIMPGLAGGFDYSQTLSGDLEQQVNSAGGMALTLPDIANYTTAWPGYADASYNQSFMPGSPEGDMALTLGTLQGVLNAGADQQASQQAEAARMTQLESENAAAIGNLQALEVGNEINLFNGQEEIKARNATNGQLNALVVAESNRQNQKAQDDLESLGVFTETANWDATNNPPGPDPQIPDPGAAQ